jgi:hypothetical protein
MKIQSTTTDLSGMPGFIEPINYDKLKSSDEVIKMFDVKDGIFSCPVTVYYEMDSPYTFNRKFGFTSQQPSLNWEYREQQDSPEKLVEQFLWDEDAVINWINDDIKKDLPMLSQFQIRKIEKITLLKGKTEESDRFLRTEYQISSEIVMEEREIIDMIKAHPKYVQLKNRAEQIAKENEILAIDAEKQRKQHLVRNNYEMWKALNAKKEAGEFDEFLKD